MDDPTSITEISSLNDLDYIDYIDDGHDDYFNAEITAEFNDYFNTWYEANNV